MRRALLALYPQAWRRRYGDELAALLEDDPPGPRATVDLVRGALMAHLHPLPGLTPAEGASNAVLGPLACFICFCFVGGGFAKATEDAPFRRATQTHSVIGATHGVVEFAAFAAAVCLMLAAVPLAWRAVHAARQSGDRRLRRLVAMPPLALGAVAATLGLLALVFRDHSHSPGVSGWLALAIVAATSLGAGAVCWAAPRAIMRRLAWDAQDLKLPVVAMAGVCACMLVMTTALATYLWALLSDAPALASSGNGPLSVLDTKTLLALELLAMFVLSAMALVSVRRGLKGLRAA